MLQQESLRLDGAYGEGEEEEEKDAAADNEEGQEKVLKGVNLYEPSSEVTTLYIYFQFTGFSLSLYRMAL